MIIKKIIHKLRTIFIPQKFSDSQTYWEERYQSGGNSGAGSYGQLANFKAETLNNFFTEHNIKSLLEFGCGDGNQLAMLNIDNYIGLDVSKKIIETCKNKFKKDTTKSFFLYDPAYFVDHAHIFDADVSLSLDVIFHLVEDTVFDKYMHDLFHSAQKYVIIYSSNTDDNAKNHAKHVKHRKFSNWIERHAPQWKLMKKIENKFPLHDDEINQSFADFYIYDKIG